MSKRQASMMEEDIEYIGTSNRSEEAQQKILAFLEKITKPHKT
jgi:flagellar motor switch protein FliG